MERYLPGYKERKSTDEESTRYFNQKTGLWEIDIEKELKKISDMGYIQTMRKGDTGVGYTLETLLGLRETNKRGKQDFSYHGIPTELKSQRSSTTSMMTLFTLEPNKGMYKDRNMIEKYGYTDSKGRQGLKVTLTTNKYVPQGLILKIDDENERIIISDEEGREPWFWFFQDIEIKIGRLVIVFADKIGSGMNEKFHYNEAYLLYKLQSEELYSLFEDRIFVVDLRMHLRKNNTVRNHGTAFRIKKLRENLFPCYQEVQRLV